MIKNFEEYINEDYFSKLANRKDNCEVRKELGEDFIRNFIKDTYNSISFRVENGKTFVDVEGNVRLKEDIEEIPFQFGKVTGSFNCSHSKKLKSFKGFPEVVNGYFCANDCENIESLEGGPKEVGNGYEITNCVKLTSLEGCAEKVEGYFTCFGCRKLTSLEGAPKIVNGSFYCKNCGRQFKREDVTRICNVFGGISV